MDGFMREIKFRAWIADANDPDQVFTDDGDPTVYSMTYDLAFEDFEPINDLLKGVNFLMQFTGLKDKNGKEIYEGDILKFRYGRQDKKSESEITIGVIQWHKAPFLRYGYGGRYLSDMDGNNEICWCEDYKMNQDANAYFRLCDFEVIGNIYEHGHLLK